MERSVIQDKVPDILQRRLVACINKALTEDLPLYLATLNPDTKNGVPHSIWDWINTNLKNSIASFADVVEFNRCGWKGKIIVDGENHMVYTVMRGKRLRQLFRLLKNPDRTHPHYAETLIKVINDNYIAKTKQMTLEFCDPDEDHFDKETLCKDYVSIFSGHTPDHEGFIYCIVTFDTSHGELSNIKIVFLDKDFDVIDEIPLNQHIKPDFAALTNITPIVEQAETPECKDSADLLSLKKRGDADRNTENPKAPLAHLRGYEKQA
jgi:hypothetical protein